MRRPWGAWYCNDVASFRSQLTSVTPMARIASATGVPCATSTSTWRSLDTISSGVCRFWGIVILRLALRSHTSGRTTSPGADHSAYPTELDGLVHGGGGGGLGGGAAHYTGRAA